MSELYRSSEADFLPTQEVFSLRSIAMGVLSEQARRIVDKPKMTGFAVFESSPDDMESGSVDTYLGVIASKPAYDYWQLTISFRSMIFHEKLRYSNTLELNRFNWNQHGRCVGTKTFIDNYNPITSSREEEGAMIDTVDPYVTEWWRPLDIADCNDIADRMLGINAAVLSNRAGNQLKIERI